MVCNIVYTHKLFKAWTKVLCTCKNLHVFFSQKESKFNCKIIRNKQLVVWGGTNLLFLLEPKQAFEFICFRIKTGPGFPVTSSTVSNHLLSCKYLSCFFTFSLCWIVELAAASEAGRPACLALRPSLSYLLFLQTHPGDRRVRDFVFWDRFWGEGKLWNRLICLEPGLHYRDLCVNKSVTIFILCISGHRRNTTQNECERSWERQLSRALQKLHKNNDKFHEKWNEMSTRFLPQLMVYISFFCWFIFLFVIFHSLVMLTHLSIERWDWGLRTRSGWVVFPFISTLVLSFSVNEFISYNLLYKRSCFVWCCFSIYVFKPCELNACLWLISYLNSACCGPQSHRMEPFPKITLHNENNKVRVTHLTR